MREYDTKKKVSYYKEVLRLHISEGYSIRKIAKIFPVSINAVSRRIRIFEVENQRYPRGGGATETRLSWTMPTHWIFLKKFTFAPVKGFPKDEVRKTTLGRHTMRKSTNISNNVQPNQLHSGLKKKESISFRQGHPCETARSRKFTMKMQFFGLGFHDF